jgi:histidinol phosphatase-like PHP family hydrolase
VLDNFDFVVASFDGRFKLDRKAQTNRLLRAISNPHTTILGYMTGGKDEAQMLCPMSISSSRGTGQELL